MVRWSVRRGAAQGSGGCGASCGLQVGGAHLQLVGLVDRWGNAHVARHDEGHYVSWVKQARAGWAFCGTRHVKRYSDAHVAGLLSKRVYRLLFYRSLQQSERNIAAVRCYANVAKGSLISRY